MTGPLWLRVPHRKGESPQSLLSRLAACNGIGVADFCRDMILPIARVADGTLSVIELLADLAGTDRTALLHDAARNVGDRWTLSGETLIRTMLRRDRLLVCACCLAEDLAGSTSTSAAYGRASWHIDQVRTCTIHDVVLLETPKVAPTSIAVHDFATRVRSMLDDIGSYVQASVPRSASGLERYLVARLQGLSQVRWLDAFPFHVVALISERVGAVALFGPQAGFGGLNDDAWRVAGDAGFEILRLGPDSLVHMLDTLRLDHGARLHTNSLGRVAYGSLWDFLLRAGQSPEYDPIRQVVAEQVGRYRAVNGDCEILGFVVPKSKVHSIRSAALATGRHPARLRDILAHKGLIPADHGDKPDGSVTFDADAAAAVLSTVAEQLTLVQVEAYLHAPRSPVRTLYEAGLITPAIHLRRERTGWLGFEPRTLDEFMASLLRGAVARETAGPGEMNIQSAARRAHRGIAEVTRWVLDRKLGWVGRLTSVRGFLSVLVRADEVVALARGPEVDGSAAHSITKRLRVEYKAVRALIENGMLLTIVVANPATKVMGKVVTHDSLERFEKDFVSLTMLARERGMHRLKLKHRLRLIELKPALPRETFGSAIYRRSELPPTI